MGFEAHWTVSREVPSSSADLAFLELRGVDSAFRFGGIGNERGMGVRDKKC